MRLRAHRISPGRASGRIRRLADAEPVDRPDPSGEPPIVAGSLAEMGAMIARFGPTLITAAILSDAGTTAGPALGPLAVPAVMCEGIDLLRTGDRATVDGDAGWIDLPEVSAVEVVTSFLRRPDGRILLLHRSQKVGTFRGLWAAVSGYLESESPPVRARIEIEEETGIPRDVPVLVGEGQTVSVRDGGRIYIAHPFLFDVPVSSVRLDWEHVAFEWVLPSEVGLRGTVPKLAEALESAHAASRVGGSSAPQSG